MVKWVLTRYNATNVGQTGWLQVARPGTFPKGKSGNPNGRPKIIEELRARCLKAVNDKVIAAWENEVDSLGNNWIKASELLAAYGLGKPSQAVELTGKDGGPIETKAAELSDEQLMAIAAGGKDK